MEVIQTHNLDGKVLYLADDLKKNNPAYFKGCSKTIRNIIGRKKIPDSHIVFATKTKTSYNVCEHEIKKARLFLTKDWVDKNFEFRNSEVGDGDVVDAKKYADAPPILLLLPEDKFVDADGKMIDIETRGEKEYDKVYFRALDIENGFKCPSLRKSVLTNDFIRGMHYETFIRKFMSNDSSDETQKQKTLYLTFKGLTRFLFVTHNKNAEHFQDWACKILFTHQMGHQDQKDDLADDLIGTRIGTVRDVFRSSVSSFPHLL